MVKYNFGSGKMRISDYINLDIDSFNNPDIVHNLNVFPYPIKKCEEILYMHSLEHLKDIGLSLSESFKFTNKIVIFVPAPHSKNYLIGEHTHLFNVVPVSGRHYNLPFFVQRLIGFFRPTEYKIVIEKNILHFQTTKLMGES